MKTNFISFPMPSLNFVIGFLSIFAITSCGSYQNSSYYDTDGIYSTTDSKIQKRGNPSESSTAYQNYFSSLQDANDSTVIFTDIDNYSNYKNQANQQNSSNYASWGSNSQDININYYPSNWGISFGYGYPYYNYRWGNPYYGWNSPYGYWNNSYYGWGYSGYYGYNYYPMYGWGGYPNYNYGHSYRGTNYSYNPSRRGSYYPSSLNPSGSYIGRTTAQYPSRYPATSDYTNNNRGSYNRMSTAPTFSRNTTSTQNQNFLYNNSARTRNYNTDNSNQNYNPTRSYNPNRSNDNYTPSRSYTPNRSNDNYSPSRSSDSNYGRSSGGGSYGGGGRRGGR